jgi:hypothetical protein
MFINMDIDYPLFNILEVIAYPGGHIIPGGHSIPWRSYHTLEVISYLEVISGHIIPGGHIIPIDLL